MASSKRDGDGGSIVELIVIVVVAVGLAVTIQAFAVKPFRIPSGSMIPTLEIGQRVLVDRISPRFSDPEVGDVVVFHPPRGAEQDAAGLPEGTQQCADPEANDEGRPCPRGAVGGEWSDQNYIKRVVAGPGDRIAVRDGRVVLNGRERPEPYLSDSCDGQTESPGMCNYRKAITVPAGHYFMMGDNRGESNDSRFWGPVPRSWIVGGAFATYWPPGRIGGV